MERDSQSRPVCASCGLNIPVQAPRGMCPSCLLRQGLSEMTAHNAAAASSFEPLSLEAMQDRFPQLEILGFVGRGGMGAVYKAKQARLNRVVALKILPVDSDRYPELSKRFVREAQTLARLNHPHIVTLYDFGEEKGLCYFIMEFVEGETLRNLMSTRRITPEEAVAIALAVCEALQYAHDQGVIHRDIKPGNILVDPSGRVKVADFGLAKVLAPEMSDITVTCTHEFMGTPYYMAPEQRDPACKTDHRADIYSLGVLMYEMLTGRIPAGSFEPVSMMCPVDLRVDDVILRALKSDPDLRYQRASELKADLEMIARSGVSSPVARQKKHSFRMGGMVALFALILSLFALWFLFKPRTLSLPEDVVEFGGNYYKVYYENVNWHEARTKCERMGGDLAIVNSQAEDEFLAAISRSHVWLGASDEAQEGVWVWVDGSEWSYSNWDYGEPNNARDPGTGEGEHYLMVSKYGKWNDLSLDSPVIKGFVCEWNGTQYSGPQKIATAADLHAALQAANPGYNGKGIVDIQDGVIVGLILARTGVTQLSPLKGVRLLSLNISWTDVTNLSPLENMPLVVLELTRSKVDDLSPLAGLPLTELRIDGTGVRDLAPLRGMPLTYLDISHSKVMDLSPLIGMPLQELHMNCVKVTDISPLAGLPLKNIGLLDVPVADLAPLEKCPGLESVVVPIRNRNFDRLKFLPKLKLLNNRLPAEFWQEDDGTVSNRVTDPPIPK